MSVCYCLRVEVWFPLLIGKVEAGPTVSSPHPPPSLRLDRNGYNHPYHSLLISLKGPYWTGFCPNIFHFKFHPPNEVFIPSNSETNLKWTTKWHFLITFNSLVKSTLNIYTLYCSCLKNKTKRRSWSFCTLIII